MHLSIMHFVCITYIYLKYTVTVYISALSIWYRSLFGMLWTKPHSYFWGKKTSTVLSTSALVRHFMNQKAKHIQSYKIYIYITNTHDQCMHVCSIVNLLVQWLRFRETQTNILLIHYIIYITVVQSSSNGSLVIPKAKHSTHF